MDRRKFLTSTAGIGATIIFDGSFKATENATFLPSIWRFRFGTPEPITPVQARHYQPALKELAQLPGVETCPVELRANVSERGCLIRIPLAENEAVYGLGLQFLSFMQRGLKKQLRVNADPGMDTGDTHAPVPFYVTTRGYGVLVDTARYARFYCGNKKQKIRSETAATKQENSGIDQSALPVAYRAAGIAKSSEMLIEVPEAQGVDVYVFGGPSMLNAVQRYNLFSGGGPVPPRWGLGVWYRAHSDASQQDIIEHARQFRDRGMPCDVIGLESGWLTHSYSCTFLWDKKFPDPAGMLRELGSQHYQVNVWEHAFTHADSPIHQSLLPYSGDYLVWNGLVPDFLSPEARRIFADFHEKEHVAVGVSGYKLDECDNSDYTGNWSFPEVSRFPSGADGEEMHSLFGLRYQDAIQSIFEKRKQRTYGLVRSSQALAAPYPYVLYSDLYDHRQFIRALVNSGFSGLLWTPEVRDARNAEDLIRRLQSVVFSPMALINAWYIKNPPWKQVNQEKNNQQEFDPQWEAIEAQCRSVLQLRMRFIPYLHAAFVRYQWEGVPPFRALVMDYPNDPATWAIDDQYMVGDRLLVAPVISGEQQRKIYLPQGQWFDFWTGKAVAGKQTLSLTVPIDRIPIFVKDGTILPLAEPTLHVEDSVARQLTVQVYGSEPESMTLYEDDGTYEPELVEVTLSWNAARNRGELSRTRKGGRAQYEVVRWTLAT